MQYRWKKSELYLKFLLSYFFHNPDYHFMISSILKQYDLSRPKGHIEKYSLNEGDYAFSIKKDYFYDCLELIPFDIIEACKDLYINFENIEYFKQIFKMPKRFFTVNELMRMLDDIIESLNDPDLLREYKCLITKKNHTFNIQTGNKNIKGELSISGMTIYDFLFHKNYINILREYNANDLFTLAHETMHAIFNNLLYENGINYDTQLLFTELEGYFGTLIAANYLSGLGYTKDAKVCRKNLLDSTLFLSLALIVGDVIFSTSSDEMDISAAIKETKIIIPSDRFVDFADDYNSYINFPALDMIINIIDYTTVIELSNRPMSEVIKTIIDIKLNNNNDLMHTLSKHNIMFSHNNFAALKKEFTEIK